MSLVLLVLGLLLALGFGLSALAWSLSVTLATVTTFWVVLLAPLDLLGGAVVPLLPVVGADFLPRPWVVVLPPLLGFGGCVFPPLSVWVVVLSIYF